MKPFPGLANLPALLKGSTNSPCQFSSYIIKSRQLSVKLAAYLYPASELRVDNAGEAVALAGWVHRRGDHGCGLSNPKRLGIARQSTFWYNQVGLLKTA